MARFDPGHDSLSFAALSGQVVVIGGSKGIGAATVKLLHSYGANVVSGDIEAPETNVGNFVKTDVTKYEDHLGLFQYAADVRTSKADVPTRTVLNKHVNFGRWHWCKDKDRIGTGTNKTPREEWNHLDYNTRLSSLGQDTFVMREHRDALLSGQASGSVKRRK